MSAPSAPVAARLFDCGETNDAGGIARTSRVTGSRP